MKPNQKLTHALQDLTAASVENASDGLTLHFEGGATSRLKGQIDPGQQVPSGASVVQFLTTRTGLSFTSDRHLAAFTLPNLGNAVAAGRVRKVV